jgi:hypothetical protein
MKTYMNQGEPITQEIYPDVKRITYDVWKQKTLMQGLQQKLNFGKFSQKRQAYSHRDLNVVRSIGDCAQHSSIFI